MHRIIEDHLEEVLAKSNPEVNSPVARHLTECSECSEEISTLRHQAALLRSLRAPVSADGDTLAPRPGFYARVMERIEAQRPIDIWQLFFDSAFGRRIAVGSMALALLFSLYLVSSERFAQPIAISVDDRPGMTLTKAGLPDKDTVLVDLVTYQEQ
jgi:hypothetical protein